MEEMMEAANFRPSAGFARAPPGVGSVQRLRAAAVDEIAAVPGFGGKTAAELKAFLLARSASPQPPADAAQTTT